MAAAASTDAAGGCSANRTVTDSSSRVKVTGCVGGVARQPCGTSSATSALAAPFEWLVTVTRTSLETGVADFKRHDHRVGGRRHRERRHDVNLLALLAGEDVAVRASLDRQRDRERRVVDGHGERGGVRRRPERQAERHVGIEHVARTLRAGVEMRRGQPGIGRHRRSSCCSLREAPRMPGRPRSASRAGQPVDGHRRASTRRLAAIGGHQVNRQRLPGHDQAVRGDRVKRTSAASISALANCGSFCARRKSISYFALSSSAEDREPRAHVAQRLEAARQRRHGGVGTARRQWPGAHRRPWRQCDRAAYRASAGALAPANARRLRRLVSTPSNTSRSVRATPPSSTVSRRR